MTVECELPQQNATSEEIKDILTESKTIAIVGLSQNPDRDSHKVAQYLLKNGYKIVPVNPAYDEVLGEKSYPSVKDVPFAIDIVDIFRKPDVIPGLVDEAIEKKAKTVWMQLGLSHNQAAKKATEAGLKVVQNKCMKIEHYKMVSES